MRGHSIFAVVALTLLTGFWALANATPASANSTITTGQLKLSHPQIIEPMPGAMTAIGFIDIENTGTDADLLLGGATEIAEHFEIHEMLLDGDIMRMRPLDSGLEIPAGHTVRLVKGGYHIMLSGLRNAPRVGQSIPVELIFQRAGTIRLEMPVIASSVSKTHSDAP